MGAPRSLHLSQLLGWTLSWVLSQWAVRVHKRICRLTVWKDFPVRSKGLLFFHRRWKLGAPENQLLPHISAGAGGGGAAGSSQFPRWNLGFLGLILPTISPERAQRFSSSLLGNGFFHRRERIQALSEEMNQHPLLKSELPSDT